MISTSPQDLSTNSTQTATSTLKEIPTNINNNSSGSDELTFLIEVVKATIPLPFQSSKKKNNHTSSSSSNRGIHCTTSWIGPINPSGYKRRCNFVHRTKTLKTAGKQDTASSSSNVDTEDIDDEEEEEASSGQQQTPWTKNSLGRTSSSGSLAGLPPIGRTRSLEKGSTKPNVVPL